MRAALPCPALFLSALVMLAAGCGDTETAPAAVGNLPPEPPREFRGVWVATVDNIDWPSKPGLPAEQQITEMRQILERATQLRMNAVVLQVRTSCDAFYQSPLEPWSEFLSGTQGVPPEPYYDPLALWVREAHRRGLELHAWFNPYRARMPAAKGPDAPTHISTLRPDLVKSFNKYEWLDPGEPEARAHTLRVILDVVRRYDIDGVHIDDYFYPYASYLGKDSAGKQVDFPDDNSWKKYKDAGGQLSRADWRRENVNTMVRELYEGIKATRRHVKFGISPFGIWRPGHPETVKAGMDQYEQLYADARLWLNKGWCDYYTPQLYWRLDSPQPYADLLRWWAGQNTQQRNLWPGNAAHRVKPDQKNAWPADEIVKQIEATRAQPGAGGNVFFSMKAFLQDYGGLNQLLGAGPYANSALVPASKWLGATSPEAPLVRAVARADGTASVRWEDAGSVQPVGWSVGVYQGGQWTYKSFPPQVRQVVAAGQPGGSPVEAVVVFAIGRTGVLSPSTAVAVAR